MAPKKTSRVPARKTAPAPGSEIAPGVFVGNWDDAQRFEGARFCVLDSPPDDMPSGTHVKIYDEETDRADPKSLDRLASGMHAARASGQAVMVFCHQGRYRSPLGGAWYLHRIERLPLDQAMARVISARSKAKPAASWVGNYTELERA